MKAHEINNHNPTKNMSILIELTLYSLYGLSFLGLSVSFDTIFSGFIGSVCTVFLVKVLAAASGSASGAKLSKTVTTSKFWLNVGVGFAFSLSISPSLYEYLKPTRPWLDVHAVYFFLGAIGVVVLRIVTKFFRGIEERADDVGEAGADAIIKKIKPRKNDAD